MSAMPESRLPRYARPWLSAIVSASALVIGACAQKPARPDLRPEGPVLTREDALWLNRVTFGLDAATVAQYRLLGREGFLSAQLEDRGTMPNAIAAQIAALPVSHIQADIVLYEVEQRRKDINALPKPPDKEQARKALDEEGNRLDYQAERREMLRAIYSSDQLREQLEWFWLNHFNVYVYKANLRWLVGDYAEEAIRPHAFGRFRDLVLATLKHPAMLEYLDNAQNAVGHVNENYARELMELHTLGVDAGYTQQDVQNLARILTGVGVRNKPEGPKLRRGLEGFYVHDGAFEFNPARHDFGSKVLLGKQIAGRGFGEVEQAVDLLVRQPACARFISRKLAAYFVSDNPPPALIDRMAQTFQATDGQISAVLRTLFNSPEFAASLGTKFKDPEHYVVSALRLAYDNRPITNTKPVIGWVNGLGERTFNHQTPDGYALTETGWASSGQMSKRFEIARQIGSGNAGLFNPEDGGAPAAGGFPQLSNRLYFDAIEPLLSPTTVSTLTQTASPQEWNTFLLASPEFNYR